jgi:hypothetical protein
VRMYLGVLYLSEICNTAGDALQIGIDDNTHEKNLYKVTMQRPKQKKPNSYSWKFWKKAIQSFTTIKTSTLDYNGDRYLSSIINCVIFRL